VDAEICVRLRLLREAFTADREGRAVHRRRARERSGNGASGWMSVTDGLDDGASPVV